MQLAKSLSVSLYGITGRIIEVETDISSNLPAFVLVGLPDASVSESAARVRAACTNSKLSLPGRKITVNLSPASVPKRGSGFDLAIAMSVLAASGSIPKSVLNETVFLGELSLDGSIKSVPGVLAATIVAQRNHIRRIVVPEVNLSEASFISGIEAHGFSHLSQVVAHFGGKVEVQSGAVIPSVASAEQQVPGCFSEVLGQDEAIQALAVAAVGGHHLQMLGPPGAGKTMLASRFPTILPELSEAQAIELATIQSVTGIDVHSLPVVPPFQSPHHSASRVSIIGGGGAAPKPGLISLAHNGVLFLDEAPEFQSDVLESLRQPLESGIITVSRASGHALFPARFQLIVAANPCPCGFAIGTAKNCTCSAVAKSRYLSRISGPLADRIDIRLQLNQVNAKLATTVERSSFTSSELKETVLAGRAKSAIRLEGSPWLLNSQVPGSFLRKELRLANSVTKNLDQALESGFLSMRGYDRCLRIAWSLADLAERATPNSEDIAEAVYLRGVGN